MRLLMHLYFSDRSVARCKVKNNNLLQAERGDAQRHARCKLSEEDIKGEEDGLIAPDVWVLQLEVVHDIWEHRPAATDTTYLTKLAMKSVGGPSGHRGNKTSHALRSVHAHHGRRKATATLAPVATETI